MTSKVVVGVDVSKLTFDVCSAKGLLQFSNDQAGFEQFAEAIPAAHIVMEVTGTYHLRLAHWLYQNGYAVSVLNPAVPKHYARMKLKRAKTDKADARVLYQFAEETSDLPLWQPADAAIIELNQLDRLLAGLQTDLTRVTNRQEALAQCDTVNAFAFDALEQQAVALRAGIRRCEDEMERLVKHHYGDLYALLQTVPGIGRRTALMFVVLTDGFTRFPGSKQFAAYLGLTSFIRQSGTSIRGSGGITKMGNGRMRQLLYMAALTARQHNPACAEFAARLSGNGKPPKVVRIAIANKLIRQAFAVVEKQQPYSAAYA